MRAAILHERPQINVYIWFFVSEASVHIFGFKRKICGLLRVLTAKLGLIGDLYKHQYVNLRYIWLTTLHCIMKHHPRN